MKGRRREQKDILNCGELSSLLRQTQIPGNERCHLFREEDWGTEARIMNLAQERYIKNKIIETTQCNNWEKRHLQSPDMSCWRCAQYPWFRHSSLGEIETKSKDSPVARSFAWLLQQQTSPRLPPAPTLLLLLIEVLRAHLWSNWCSVWCTANLLSISALAGQLNFFLLHDSTDHKVQNKKCKSQRQSLLEMQLWNKLAEEMREIQLEHLWDTMKNVFHHKQDDVHSITIPSHLRREIFLTIKKMRTREIQILHLLTSVFSHEQQFCIKLLW